MTEPNRHSGDWLEDVANCPTRAVPCGNPYDADEAMRAGQILAANTDIASISAAETAMKNAKRVAKRCTINRGQCPLEQHFGTDRLTALEKLKKSVQK
jgi:hypothetical protein